MRATNIPEVKSKHFEERCQDLQHLNIYSAKVKSVVSVEMSNVGYGTGTTVMQFMRTREGANVCEVRLTPA